MTDSAALTRARALATRFRTTFQTVILGTSSAAAEPDASVAAGVLGADGAIYVYVSGLAAHTRNLLATGRASVLLIEDESITTQLLARRRLTFPCTAAPVARDGAEFPPLIAAFHEKFGAAIVPLSALADFQIIRLELSPGRLVAGFGEAYTVDPSDWAKLTPLGGRR